MASVQRYAIKAGRRYRVRYRQPNGRTTARNGFKTRQAAQQFANTVEVAKLDRTYIAPARGRITVSELGLPRQAHVKVSWSTRRESLWRVHVEPFWGERSVASITRPEVTDWIAGIDRAPSTVADIHTVLCAVLDRAVEESRIPTNPARGVKLPRRSATEHNYLTHAQVAALVAEAKHPEIVALLAYSGLRWGEMAALRPRDIEARRIHIVRSASKVNSRSVMTTPKTWERRTIAVPGALWTCSGRCSVSLLTRWSGRVPMVSRCARRPRPTGLLPPYVDAKMPTPPFPG